MRAGRSSVNGWMARAAGAVLVAAAVLAGGAAAARGKPDLVVASIADPALTVVAGGAVSVTEAVRNGGTARARASAVGYYLSRDTRAGGGDVRVAARRPVAALAPRERSRRKVSLRIPAGTKAGAYHVVACADAARKVSERSERNNCRASKGRVAVTLRPRPLAVTPVLDAARATSATIGAQGGTLAATTASGATIALVVPAGAVLSDVTITMTPLAAVTGLPFPRGLVAGVHLAPDGLRFLEPATLALTPATPLAAGDHAAFAYRGNGESFHLVRSRAEGNAISLSLTHFSGAGVAQASGAETASVASSNPPADPADQAEQQAAVPVDTGAMEGAVLSMYAVVSGLVQARETIDQAVMLYNAWYPLALSTRAGGLWVMLHGQLTKKMLQFIAEARAACAIRRDLSEAGWILRIGRQSQTLVVPVPRVVAAAGDAVSRCVRFELDVTADIANNLELDRGTMQARVTALPIGMTSGFVPEQLSGNKGIEVLAYAIEDFDCWRHTWNPQPGRPYAVAGMKLSGLNPFAAPGPVDVESLRLDHGSVNDEVTHTCTDGGSFTAAMAIWDIGVSTIVGQQVSVARSGQGSWTRQVTVPPLPGQPSGTVTYQLRHTPQP